MTTTQKFKRGSLRPRYKDMLSELPIVWASIVWVPILWVSRVWATLGGFIKGLLKDLARALGFNPPQPIPVPIPVNPVRPRPRR